MRKLTAVLLGVVGLVAAAVVPVNASHTWSNFHWARTSNPFTLRAVYNLSGDWVPHLDESAKDWSDPKRSVPTWNGADMLDLTIARGRVNCRNGTAGMIEVCNGRYGQNGWLGLAQVWVYSDGHIDRGTVKVNDTYFSMPAYNTPAWKRSVMCQEIGHTFGLGHQDENFSTNLGSCMDYSNPPSPSPNPHDFEVLQQIYSHTDGWTTIRSTSALGTRLQPGQPEMTTLGNPDTFGTLVRDNGYTALFVQDLGGGRRLYTWVVWATRPARAHTGSH